MVFTSREKPLKRGINGSGTAARLSGLEFRVPVARGLGVGDRDTTYYFLTFTGLRVGGRKRPEHHDLLSSLTNTARSVQRRGSAQSVAVPLL
jgi:hypothetical protein